MVLESVPLFEGPPAKLARIGALSRVHPAVFLVVGLSPKPLLAKLANMSLVRVHLGVRPQITKIFVLFTAFSAAMIPQPLH